MDAADDSTATDDQGASDPLLTAMGKRLRELRLAAGMTFQDLADAAGVSRGYVYRMETGKQNASVRSLSRVAIALSTTISSLLEGVDADPSTLGTRKYTWRDGADPRDPDRPLGRRRKRGGEQGDATG